ncbi:hypothetical protein PN498_01090 [Oscillatoria sp. CS-180]|uniref:hypothetical protein n=1 Tax=Oscillatoria sp. CS-180 TaxID=3021720 RepID=UPI00232D8E1A|nr:hypothetical protein [Oscillatoria sp. CS-180]MDB9524568.1 hypothetical protein [Oscillatoria sp. CS-180]
MSRSTKNGKLLVTIVIAIPFISFLTIRYLPIVIVSSTILLNPNDMDAYHDRAVIRREVFQDDNGAVGDYSRIIDFMEQAESIDESLLFEAYFQRASLYWQIARSNRMPEEKAQKLYKKSLRDFKEALAVAKRVDNRRWLNSVDIHTEFVRKDMSTTGESDSQ